MLLGIAHAAAAADPVPTGLRVEYAETPLGIDEPAPRLAWYSPVARQNAYRIRVATSPEALARGETVWDSGKVASDANVQIAYAGPPLAARLRYWWQVQVWGDDGVASNWSAPGWWEMGLLSPQDWRGQWIAGQAPPRHDWSALKLDVDLTLTGASIDILFRARPNGKTYGDAYVWTLSDAKDGPALIESVRTYPGGTSSAVTVRQLKRVPLAGPLKGRHRLTIMASGTRIVTSIDGKPVDVLDDATHAHGTIGFLASEARAATIHSVAVSGTGSPAFRTGFAQNDNPFTGGAVAADGLVVASGVPRVDLVLPIEAPAPLVRRAFRLGKPIARARLYYAGAGMPRMLVNGASVSSPLGVGFTAYDKRVLTYAYDVTALLRPGRMSSAPSSAGAGTASPTPMNGISTPRPGMPSRRSRHSSKLPMRTAPARSSPPMRAGAPRPARRSAIRSTAASATTRAGFPPSGTGRASAADGPPRRSSPAPPVRSSPPMPSRSPPSRRSRRPPSRSLRPASGSMISAASSRAGQCSRSADRAVRRSRWSRASGSHRTAPWSPHRA
ncbi:alpha-L-rhamnosidase N-terminal domain-containing protein [Sphingomonas sp. 7/4-4]|nr:alpha-L-rhamnosidase N-terminal domain-containing protein [Sphingomonas sp. 7/4-4]WBY08034.1 alpha-L-rhamnosidase N-terminal domain-containing protein [Sphingomonas sp. 7/4-4]